MIDQSITTIIKKIIKNYGIQKKINTLIFSDDKEIDFKKIQKIITKKNDNRIIISDILSNKYFDRNLSLFQNIKLNMALLGLEIEPFLNKFRLNKEFKRLKNYNFQDIGREAWFKYEILLYVYSNKDLLIEKNIFNLKDASIDLSCIFREKEVFFITFNKMQLKHIHQFFDVFIYITDNKLDVYKNFETFADSIPN